MTVLWTTTELPGHDWDPEPDEDDDGPWCDLRCPVRRPQFASDGLGGVRGPSRRLGRSWALLGPSEQFQRQPATERDLMPRVIHARDVDAALADGGHDPSEFVCGHWEPGYRTAQNGRRQVLVFHDGPGEQDGLDAYRLVLQAAGWHVVTDQQTGGRRRRLSITRP